ncbi:MAG: threonylcarbamoyl-AMP synthase [Oscillospiraceae bacterium]|nr:threonylcarbamoyl-AMP synthase [Oscillospiraceae bacterium]
MKTVIFRADDPQTPKKAAEIIRAGGLVAIPTETVYGLGANAMDEAAVAKIFQAKGRPQDNPLIIHISCADELERYCHDIPQSAYLLAERFWPGPLTMVLPVRDCIPKSTVSGNDTVAVRCPKTAVTRALIAEAGVPIAAPSANLSGKPSTTTAEHVLNDYGEDGLIDAIIDGGPSAVGVESTIVDLTGVRPRLLRPGGVTPEELKALLGELEIDRAIFSQISNDTVVRAPGMKYKHYAPSAEVYIVTGSGEAAAAYVRRHYEQGDAVLCFEEELPLFADCNPTAYGRRADVNTLSAGLFAALRSLDRPEIKRIYARCPEGGGVAYAVGNRLKKAAAFRCIDAEAEL